MATVDELMHVMIAAGKVLAANGHKDATRGHVSVRHPDDPHRVLIKPHRIGFEEMNHDNIVTIDLDGNHVAGPDRLHSERFIHTEIYKVRSDVNSVIHTHPKHAIALSGTSLEWKVFNHGASLFYGDKLARYNTTMERINTPQLGAHVAKTLGQGRGALLKNHGIVVADKSIAQAVMAAISLEEAAEIQLFVAWTGAAREEFPRQKLEEFERGHSRAGQAKENFAYFARAAGYEVALQL